MDQRIKMAPKQPSPKMEIEGTTNRIQLRKGSGLQTHNDVTNQTPHVQIDRPTYLLGILIAPLRWPLSEAVTIVTLVIKKPYNHTYIYSQWIPQYQTGHPISLSSIISN